MNKLLNLGIASMIAISLCACHETKEGVEEPPIIPDNPPEVVDLPDINGKVFGEKDGFCFTGTYMGSGGQAYFDIKLSEGQHVKISLTDGNKGTLQLYTDPLYLSSIEGNPVKGKVERPSFIGLGIQPIIPIKLTPNYQKGRYEYSGEEEIYGVKVKISNGIATADSLKCGEWYVSPTKDFESLNPNAGILGKESPLYFIAAIPDRDINCHFSHSLFICDLKSSSYPSKYEQSISLSDLVLLILNTSCIKEKDYGFDQDSDRLISLGKLWGRIIPGVSIPHTPSRYPLSFGIAGLYKDQELYYEPISVYPPNTFCASHITESSYALTFDPLKMMGMNIVKRKTADSYETYPMNTEALYSLLSNIFLTITPRNAEGVAINYIFKEEGDELLFNNTFADSAMGISVLKNMISTVFTNSESRDNLISTLKGEGISEDIISAVGFALDNIDELFGGCETSKFGWTYVRQSHELSHYYNDFYGD